MKIEDFQRTKQCYWNGIALSFVRPVRDHLVPSGTDDAYRTLLLLRNTIGPIPLDHLITIFDCKRCIQWHWEGPIRDGQWSVPYGTKGMISKAYQWDQSNIKGWNKVQRK